MYQFHDGEASTIDSQKTSFDMLSLLIGRSLVAAGSTRIRLEARALLCLANKLRLHQLQASRRHPLLVLARWSLVVQLQVVAVSRSNHDQLAFLCF